MGVALSGFFRWRNRPVSARHHSRAWLSGVVMQIWREPGKTYGARRIRAEHADAHGQVVNLKLVRSITQQRQIAGLPSRRRYNRSGSNRYMGVSDGLCKCS